MKDSYFIDRFLPYLETKLRVFCDNLVSYKNLLIKITLPLFIIFCGFYFCTSSHRLVKKDINDVFLVSDSIRESYVSKPDYWGLSTKEALNQSIVPNTYIHKGHIVLSSGKEILIGNGIAPDVVMPRSQTFDIVIKNLTKGECMAYAEYNIPQEDIIKLQQIQIVNDTVYTFEWGGGTSLPVKRYATKDICKKQGNTLIWTIK
jgi:hypothetical protein